MISAIDTSPKVNFTPQNLPDETASFYNSKMFIQNEVHFLSTMESMDNKAQQRGLEEIKKAIKGET